MNAALDQLSDAELSKLFAEVVRNEFVATNGCCYPTEGHYAVAPLCGGWALPPFANSADAVLPFMRNYEYVDVSREHEDPPREWCVVLSPTRTSRPIYIGQAPTFARAACIALIRAKRAEKGQP